MSARLAGSATRIASRLVALASIVAVWQWTDRVADDPSRAIDSCVYSWHTPPSVEACVAQHPYDVNLLLLAGAADERAGSLASAEARYRQAIRLDPNDGETRVRLARVLLRLGDRDGAREHAEQALRVRPNDAMIIELVTPGHRGEAVP